MSAEALWAGLSGFTTIDAVIVLLLLFLPRKKDFLEQEEIVIINKDGREALEDTCTRVTNFRWLSVICIFCIQIKDYKGSYKLIQGQVFFSSSELAVPEHKYAVS